MGLTDDDIREILRIVDESDVAELEIETESFSLYVRRGSSAGDAPSRSVHRSRPVRDEASPSAAAPAPDTPAASAEVNGLVTVASPMLGTFYRAESPGAVPFVEVGSTVGPDTIVCIIEVMKMMNSVPAGIAGTVVEVCAGDGELVESGEPLLRVAPGAPA